MKRIFSVLFILISTLVLGQCTYDENCTISPAFPNICPINLPDATAGEAYNTDLTFWLPTQFQAEGFDVNLSELTVTQVAGLPLGLSVELSNESMVFYPAEDEFGCANVSGIPFASGDYVLTIYVVATVTVSDFEIAYPTEFNLFLTVNPGSGGNNSFTYTPNNGCEDLNVTYEALITSDDYDVEYIWDFGNGETSNEQYPPEQLYSESGDYSVSLTTNLTTTETTLNSFRIDWVSADCYGGDAEELCWPDITDPLFGFTLFDAGCWSDPDLYIKIYDGNNSLIYQTGGIGSGEYVTGTSAVWSNIDLDLINPPYTVEIWDTEAWDVGGDELNLIIDALGIDPQFSQDDLLGSYVLNLEGGDHEFQSDCSGGTYSVSSVPVALDPIVNTEIISVFEQPDLETMLWESPDQTQTGLGPMQAFVEYNGTMSSYQWFLDGIEISGENEATCPITFSGVYYVEFVTENGCMGMSSPLLIVNDDLDDDGIPNDEDDDVDGDGISNDEDDDVDGDGISNDEDDDVDGDGIPNDEDDTISGYLNLNELFSSQLSVFPNPSNGVFNIQLKNTVNVHSARVIVTDMMGHLIVDRNVDLIGPVQLDLGKLAPAFYLLNVYIEDYKFTKRIIIK